MLQRYSPRLSLLTFHAHPSGMCHALNLSHSSCNQAGSDHDILLQVRTGVTMVQTEGYAALMSGVSATVARGLFYGGRLFVADSAASPYTHSWQRFLPPDTCQGVIYTSSAGD